jgi:hypothetical protein
MVYMTSDIRAGRQGQQWFVWVFALTLALKIALAASFPLTGDEAFFLQWGHHPALGYSDHPPMVGWWLAGLLLLGDHPLLLRLPTLAVTSVLALGLVDVLLRYLPPSRRGVAWWAGVLYLLMPWSWLFVLVTTDTPLLFFMGLSVWAFLRAEADPRSGIQWYAWAGLAVGCAFLSKYFAALLGIAYGVHLLWQRRDRAWAIPWMLVWALPAIALNLWFNAGHGWPNVMFNFINRHAAHSGFQVQTVAVYALMMAYLLTPWLCWHAWRQEDGGGHPAVRRALAMLWVFPLGLFALLSWRRDVGLHWVLGFVPVFVAWAAFRIPIVRWRGMAVWTLALSLPHLVLVAALMALPLSQWQATRWYDKVVFLREVPAILAELDRDRAPDVRLMAHAYSPAAILAYHHGAYVPVYGPGRHHARQDDLLVDFRAWDGANVRVFMRQPIELSEHAPYFERVQARSFVVQGITYHMLEGWGMRYGVYRERVLADIARQFHGIPGRLPVWGHPFCERYGFAECAPGRPTQP